MQITPASQWWPTTIWTGFAETFIISRLSISWSFFSRYNTQSWVSVGNQFVAARNLVASEIFDKESEIELETEERGAVAEGPVTIKKRTRPSEQSNDDDDTAASRFELLDIRNELGNKEDDACASSVDNLEIVKKTKTVSEPEQKTQSDAKAVQKCFEELFAAQEKAHRQRDVSSNDFSAFVRLVEENDPSFVTVSKDNMQKVFSAWKSLTDKSALKAILIRGAYARSLAGMSVAEQEQLMETTFGKHIAYTTLHHDASCFYFVQRHSLCVYFPSKNALLTNKTKIENYIRAHPTEAQDWNAKDAPKSVTLAWMLQA